MELLKNLIGAAGIALIFTFTCIAYANDGNYDTDVARSCEIITEDSELCKPIASLPVNKEILIEVVIPEEPVPTDILTDDEIALVALVTMAEAEGESELGKRLVIDTVLNRVESSEFPNDIYEVVYQDGQFSGMCEERLQRCTITEEVCQLVREELVQRVNSEVLYFRGSHYHNFGTPIINEGNHYFSGI